MTEKRFTIKPSMIVDDVTVIIDNQKEYAFPILHSTLNYMFCKALNEQYETIQRLKQNIDELMQLDVAEDLLKENEQLRQKVDFYKYFQKDARELEKENEQLKQSNELLADMADKYKELRDLLEEENEQLKQQMLNLEEDLGYFKAKASSLEEGYLQLQDREIRLKKELFEVSKELLWATSDDVDKALYYEDEVEELRKEIFK